MSVEVLIHAGAGEIRVALVAEGKLQELFFERTLGREQNPRGGLIGDIILGRVSRVAQSMQAAFVDIGQAQAGFLALREARCLAKNPGDDTAISDCVREGDSVLVQVVKDPIGEKGARLTAAITLPGRMLVMTPFQPGIMMSRRIEQEADRCALNALGEQLLGQAGLVPGAGFIFRTVALGACLQTLTADALDLSQTWQSIQDKRRIARPPATLCHDLGPVERSLRDWVRGDVVRIRIDDALTAEVARAYCRKAMPDMESLIETVTQPALCDFEDEIAALALPRADLPSGGWITIEATEALTAIDVNSGRFTASAGLEETSLAVNLEAAVEIGRQIRLRGIGGLIIVDFIHLENAGNAGQVLGALEKSLSLDRAPVQVSPMSEFGIVAITRKRVREPLARLVGAHCAQCAGTGRVPSIESVGYDILRRIEAEARAAPGREVLCDAAPDVAAWLLSHETEIREALIRRGAPRVRFQSANFPREKFDVRHI